MEEGVSAAATTKATPTVLDTYPEVAPLIDSGVAALSRSVLTVVNGQVESSTAELQTLARASTLVAAQYAEVKDSVAELSAFYASHAALAGGLAPHYAVVEELERCALSLEESARDLDEQTKTLEQVFTQLL